MLFLPGRKLCSPGEMTSGDQVMGSEKTLYGLRGCAKLLQEGSPHQDVLGLML